MGIFGLLLFLVFALYCLLHLSEQGTPLRSRKSMQLRSKALFLLLPTIPLVCVWFAMADAMGLAFVSAGAYYCFRFGWGRWVAAAVWFVYAVITPSIFPGTLLGIASAFVVDMMWNWQLKRTDAWFKTEAVH